MICPRVAAAKLPVQGKSSFIHNQLDWWLTVGKDFKAGLMAGVVLAGIALIWVATRPSLSPQARMARAAPPPVVLIPAPESESLNPLSQIVERASEPEIVQEPAGPDASKPAANPAETSNLRSQVSTLTSQPAGPDLTIYEMNEPIKTTRFHIVRKGETLSAISQQYYGSKEKWRAIVAANPKAIKDANKIAPGTKLIIPEN